MDKNAKIYIAGHNGLVGSAIKRRLLADGYTNIIGRTSTELNLADEKATDIFFEQEKPEFVFLAAAKVGGIMANNIYRADFIYQNLLVQNSVIGSSYKHGVKKLLFLGSSCIYPKNAEQPIREDSLLTSDLEYTNEPYAIAKIAGIKLAESFNIQYGTNFLSVMPTNLYGHNDNYDLEKSHVLPALIRKVYLSHLLETGDLQSIAKNLEINFESEEQIIDILNKHGVRRSGNEVTLEVWGTGTPRREFMHSDDMAAACVFIMNNVNFSDLTKDMKEIKNTHINIGTGTDVTIKELATMIKEKIGFEGQIAFDATKPDGTMRKLMSSAKLNQLGWTHSIELKDGIARVIDTYLAEQNA